jgi:L-fuculokinase
MQKVVVVLDIGKTNKKVALYDENLKFISKESKSFPALPMTNIPDRFSTVDGALCKHELRQEQVLELEQWFLDQLAQVAKSYQVQAISITTHGAGAVCVGADGLPAVPVIDYTCEVNPRFHEAFHDLAGSPRDLQLSTNTAELKPLINVAKLVYFTRETFPEDFPKAKHLLLYPQYFSFRLTGKVWADYTYLGCHTYLWDFARNTWSSVVDDIGIRNLLPASIGAPGDLSGTITPEVAKRTGLPPTTPVLVGVHDSNSSLIPYLLAGAKNFVLNSTGTWCVAMKPEEQAVLRPQDIGKTVFYNLSVENKPVKTAIFLGGLEFQTWTELLQSLNNRKDYPAFSQEITEKILKEADLFILPGVVQGAGQYPESKASLVWQGTSFSLSDLQAKSSKIPEILYHYEETYAALLLSLALHTKAAFDQLDFSPGTEIYTEGGFRQTPGYNILMASLFPNNPLYTTEIEEATSYGAALLGWAHGTKEGLRGLSKFATFEKHPFSPVDLKGLDEYSGKFFQLVAQGS